MTGPSVQESLDQTSPEAYGRVIFIAFISIVTGPLTTAMNALIIIAVKTKHRLKSKSIITLHLLYTFKPGGVGMISQTEQRD